MSDLSERELGAQLKRDAMDPNKRGNPPFEPSSYAAGLERRIKRHERWASTAREAARWMLEGTEHEKQFGAQWWREQLDQPRVIASAAGGRSPETAQQAQPGGRQSGGGEASATPNPSRGDTQ